MGVKAVASVAFAKQVEGTVQSVRTCVCANVTCARTVGLPKVRFQHR